MARFVVSPDKFKGSLGAAQVAQAIGTGLRRGWAGVEVVLLPVADGGEGTVEAAVAAGFEHRTIRVTGPDGAPLEAGFAIQGDRAVVELAEASGLRHLAADSLLPMTATTRGTGELIGAALDAGAREIVLGVGGSATTDGGVAMMQALGVRALDAGGADIGPGGAALAAVDRVDVSGLDPRLASVRVVLAGDVDNPLSGEHGAAAVYAPQKGADPEQVAELDEALARWGRVLARDLGVDVAATPGAGAAGGTGSAAIAFLGAEVRSGIELMLEVVGFHDAVRGADWVVTGEGSLDAQSLAGKAPVGVARAARAAGVPVVAMVGRNEVGEADLHQVGITRAYDLLSRATDLEHARRDAAALLEAVAAEFAAGLARSG